MNRGEYAGQFVLSQSPIEDRPEWSRFELHGWHLHAEPSLPVCRLCNSSNITVGFVLGYFVSKGEFTPDTVYVDDNVGDEWNDDAIYELGGRWICILLTASVKRVYLDPSGSFPVVFDKNTKSAASSSTLLSNDIDRQLLSSLQLPRSGLYIPFGYTAHRGVSRLLPNHFLDLEDMICRRHWFRKRSDKKWDLGQACHILSDVLKGTVEAVSKKRKLCVPLTGGRDSRMLLAACRNILDSVEFVTVRTTSIDVDVHLTTVLRNRFGIRHRYIAHESASVEELDNWQKAVGYCVGGRAWLDHKSYASFDSESILMPSICGEIGRGFFYKSQDDYMSHFSALDLLLRMKLPRYDALEVGAANYLDELRALGLDHFEMLDHVYNEQRLGSWAGPTELGGDCYTAGKMWPLCNRRAIAVLHETPIEHKISNALPNMVIDNLWPELNAIPFNTFTGPFSFAMDFQRLARRAPKYIIDRLRARGLV